MLGNTTAIFTETFVAYFKSCKQKTLAFNLPKAATAATILLLISASRSHFDVIVLSKYRNLSSCFSTYNTYKQILKYLAGKIPSASIQIYSINMFWMKISQRQMNKVLHDTQTKSHFASQSKRGCVIIKLIRYSIR